MGSPDQGLGVGLVGFTFGEEQEAANKSCTVAEKRKERNEKDYEVQRNKKCSEKMPILPRTRGMSACARKEALAWKIL